MYLACLCLAHLQGALGYIFDLALFNGYCGHRGSDHPAMDLHRENRKQRGEDPGMGDSNVVMSAWYNTLGFEELWGTLAEGCHLTPELPPSGCRNNITMPVLSPLGYSLQHVALQEQHGSSKKTIVLFFVGCLSSNSSCLSLKAPAKQ